MTTHAKDSPFICSAFGKESHQLIYRHLARFILVDHSIKFD